MPGSGIFLCLDQISGSTLVLQGRGSERNSSQGDAVQFAGSNSSTAATGPGALETDFETGCTR